MVIGKLFNYWIFKSIGNVPINRDRLVIWVRVGTRRVVQSLSKEFGIGSSLHCLFREDRMSAVIPASVAGRKRLKDAVAGKIMSMWSSEGKVSLRRCWFWWEMEGGDFVSEEGCVVGMDTCVIEFEKGWEKPRWRQLLTVFGRFRGLDEFAWTRKDRQPCMGWHI